MALTIGSAGSEAERYRRLAVHGAGLCLGAMTMALLLVLVGKLVEPVLDGGGGVLAIVVMALAAGWTLRVAAGMGPAFPRRRWQVPHEWRHTLPPRFVDGAYGYLLGLGVLTDVVLPAFWVLVASTLALADLPVAIAAWLLYAVVRISMTRRASTVVACARGEAPENVNGRASFGSARVATIALLLAVVLTMAPQMTT